MVAPGLLQPGWRLLVICPLPLLGESGSVGMIGILACGLGRCEHPQGHTIGLNASDEWTGDSVLSWIEGGKWEQKKGNQKWIFHIFLNCHLVFNFFTDYQPVNSDFTLKTWVWD